MLLNKDFKEFIQSLNECKVKYLIVGGYAVAIHGHPRYTKDLDVWIQAESHNAENLIKALEQFGFSSLNLNLTDFTSSDNIIQLGYPPNRIDILTSISGDLDFDTCYHSKVELKIDDTLVHFIDLDNLRKNKSARARLQDLADLENLQ